MRAPFQCSRDVGGRATHLAFVLAAVLAACQSSPWKPYEYNVRVPVPQPSEVDAVVFLVGDGGEMVKGRSPLLERLTNDVEFWSARLARDSAVSIVFLGDIVYPSGVHERGTGEFPVDSAHLWNQINLLAGEAALRHKSVGLFLTGNHDWGNMHGPDAVQRVKNLESEIILAREQGPRVALLPSAGDPGPVVRDLRSNVRLVFMDSHWFLQNPPDSARVVFFDALQEALRTAGDREVVLLAHHPFATAGPHGVVAFSTSTFGLLYLLQRSGAIVQDLNSPAYGHFRDQMRLAFRETGRVPLVFAAGHDHSLQVLDGRQEGDPRHILVSGAASKLTSLGDTVGMRYGATRPGYMSLVFRKDDTVDLFVTAGRRGDLICPATPDDARVRCMTEAVDSFQIVYSETLSKARPVVTEDEESDTSKVAADSAGNGTTSAARPTPKTLTDTSAIPTTKRGNARADTSASRARVDSTKADTTRKADSTKGDTARARGDSVKADSTGKSARADSTAPRTRADSVAAELAELDPTPTAVAPERVSFGTDTVVAAPGQTYSASFVRRFLMGDLNRDLWKIEFPVPVLNLDSVGGGLTPSELSGGKQTLGLRLEGKDGLVYQFRSIVKDASRALPGMLQSSPVDDVIQDQMAAQFPLSAAIVAELLNSAGVLVAKPTAVIMPDDPRLGEYREAFAGRMGWIEVRPDERSGDRPGFAGSSKVTGSDELFENLIEEPETAINEHEYVRARLIDMFVGDWDRHADNWRWAGFEEGDRMRWDPIPRDRDWAFARIDGVIPRIAGVFYPKYVGFGDDYPAVKRLMWAGSLLDRRLLGGVDRDVFVEEARALQSAFSDSVIDQALHTLPMEYREVEEERLRKSLRERRDALADRADEFYHLLAGWVDVYGTETSDSVDVEIAEDNVHVRLFRGAKRFAGIDRTFVPDETGEVRLYLISGKDVVTVHGSEDSPLRVRIIGTPGFVRLVHGNNGSMLSREGALPIASQLSFHHTHPDNAPPEEAEEASDEIEAGFAEPATKAWDTRDWGSQWMLSPAIDYQSEFGFHLGLKLTRFGFGFRQDPHDSRFDIEGLVSEEPRRITVGVKYEKRIGLQGLATRFEYNGYTSRHSRYYGIGNETVDEEDEGFYLAFRSYMDLNASVLYSPPNESWSAWIGPRFVRWGDLKPANVDRIFDTDSVPGLQGFNQTGLQAGLEIDNRDAEDLPRKGSILQIEGRAFPIASGFDGAYGGLSGTFRSYLTLPGPFDPVVHLRLFGERVWGHPPYPEMASLGGRRSLPGYRTQRFLGDAAASGSAILRLSLLQLGAAKGIGMGVFGVATAGRVWIDAIEDDGTTLHSGFGGGFFLRSNALNRAASIAFVRGDRDFRTYLSLGLPF